MFFPIVSRRLGGHENLTEAMILTDQCMTEANYHTIKPQELESYPEPAQRAGHKRGAAER